MGGLAFFCAACGDTVLFGPCGGKLDGKPYCQECFNELKFGKVGPPPNPTWNGRYGSLLDETGPWQDNAIRAMEGE